LIISILALLSITELFLIMRLQARLKKLFMGTHAQNLEEIINLMGHHIEKLEKDRDEMANHFKIVDEKLAKSIRSIETIRFNPFEESGSNQSFATAMINDEGNGVILSSIYARDRMSVFAKPVIEGKPTQDLSKEEKEVFEKAKK